MNIKKTEENGSKDQSNDSASDDVIQLVDRLFKSVASEINMPKDITLLLANLHTPYLKIAKETPNLFAIENHQARVFLSKAIKISKTWNQEYDTNNSYIKKLESVINNIVNLKNYESTVFIKAELDLEKQISRIQKRHDIKLKREKEKSLGQEKILKAKHLTKNTLIEKMTGKKIPVFAKELLLSEWFNVLVLLNLRFSLKSKEYVDKLNFVDYLIEYSQLNTETVISEDEIYNLAREYKSGLLLVAFNPIDCENKHNDFIKNLINNQNTITKLKNESQNTQKTVTDTQSSTQTIKKVIEPSPVDQVAQKKQEKIVVEPLKPDAMIPNKKEKQDNPVDRKLESAKIQPEEVLDISQYKKKTEKSSPQINKELINLDSNIEITEKEQTDIDYNEIMSSITIGTWFEFTSHKTPIKAKLSWISPISEKYLFVDSNGIKLTDKTKSDLMTGLKNESIKILHKFI